MYRIVHESKGRIRLRPSGKALSSVVVASWLKENTPSGVIATVSAVTGSILVLYSSLEERKNFERIFLAHFGGKTLAVSEKKKKPLFFLFVGNKEELEEKPVRNPIPGKLMSYLLPMPVRTAMTVLSSIPYIFTGAKEVAKGKVGIDVLDGAALLVCLLRRDFASAGAITFFFALGEYLADWTQKKSRASLEESLALNIDKVWIKIGDLEQQVHISEVKKGDLVVVRSGAVFPVDGNVSDGDGMVNQASMTGETMSVHKTIGSSVYAGTVLEEGTLTICASKVGGETRIRSIIRTIEDSEQVKASIQSKYEHMADSIVPFNFLLSGAVFAVTRNAMRASSVLMVDYSCALRLSTPLCIYTAMRQAANQGILIKGGKFMESLHEATAVVFDKTGTLTEAKPELVDVIPFGDRDRKDVLRISACLEEHFAHPVGIAVVKAADKEKLHHREEHAEVQYVVAHGIASRWNDQDVVIGSEHFVREDRKISITKEQQLIINKQASQGRSVLYLGIGNELAGILLIEDKIRDETPRIIETLKSTGIQRILMLTGDGGLTAASIAEQAGIDEFRHSLLPEEKAEIVAELKAQGHKVIMVGDGINDSPALSIADVGVAMGNGADIAREVADVVLVKGELEGLLLSRAISRKALKKVRNQFYASVGLNSLFLLGGLFSLISPAMSALLHNATTAALALSSVKGLSLRLDKEQKNLGLSATIEKQVGETSVVKKAVIKKTAVKKVEVKASRSTTKKNISSSAKNSQSNKKK